MADERPCCVWCKATMASGPRLRSRKSTDARLCLKCTLWALTGQTPPYVPPRKDVLMMRIPPPAIRPDGPRPDWW